MYPINGVNHTYLLAKMAVIITSNISYMYFIGKHRKDTRNSTACSAASCIAPTQLTG